MHRLLGYPGRLFNRVVNDNLILVNAVFLKEINLVDHLI